jgi:hypothetical protein
MREKVGFTVKLACALVGLVLPAVGMTQGTVAPLRGAPMPEAPSEAGMAKDKAGATPINERFPSLEAYLAYLEKRAPMDGPWYRQVGPGLYELQTGNLRLSDGPRAKRTFTREDLERRFGFAR